MTHTPRKSRSGYFWLMFWLWALLALGLALLLAGLLTGAPPRFPLPGMMA